MILNCGKSTCRQQRSETLPLTLRTVPAELCYKLHQNPLLIFQATILNSKTVKTQYIPTKPYQTNPAKRETKPLHNRLYKRSRDERWLRAFGVMRVQGSQVKSQGSFLHFGDISSLEFNTWKDQAISCSEDAGSLHCSDATQMLQARSCGIAYAFCTLGV